VYGTFKIEGKEQKIEGKKEEDSIRIVKYCLYRLFISVKVKRERDNC